MELGCIKSMSIYTAPIEKLHFEPTSECNARCPLCPRTYHQSLRTHPLLNRESWDKETLNTVLDDKLFKNLNTVLINGNFGDIIIHPDPRQIIQTFIDREYEININTNGGAQGSDFWKWLGKQSNIKINFGIDGLEDTHSLYRRNTVCKTVLKNAINYINAGGEAVWTMTVFKNNEHQIDDCRKLANTLGFSDFEYRISDRHTGDLSIVDKNFEHEYFLASKTSEYALGFDKVDYEKGLLNYNKTFATREKSLNIKTKIKCTVQNEKSIFLSYDKRLWPCCWTAAAFELEKNKIESRDVLKIFHKDYSSDVDFNKVNKHAPSDIFNNTNGFQLLEKTWKSSQPCITCQNTCGG